MDALRERTWPYSVHFLNGGGGQQVFLNTFLICFLTGSISKGT